MSRMGTLECVRESLRLALDELAGEVGERQRPEFWNRLWERYVDSQPDYQASPETLKQKMTQVGEDLLQLRTWLAAQPEACRPGEKVRLLERVWSEQFQLAEGGGVVRKTEIPATPLRTPHDPEAQWCTKKTGDAKKEWVGYKAQVAETVPAEPLQKGKPTPAFITGIVARSTPPAATKQGWARFSNSKPRWDWRNRPSSSSTAPTLLQARPWPRRQPKGAS